MWHFKFQKNWLLHRKANINIVYHGTKQSRNRKKIISAETSFLGSRKPFPVTETFASVSMTGFVICLHLKPYHCQAERTVTMGLESYSKAKCWIRNQHNAELGCILLNASYSEVVRAVFLYTVEVGIWCSIWWIKI